MSTESRKLNDGRTVTVRHGAAGEVKVGDVLVVAREIVHVTGRRFGPPRGDEVDRQVVVHLAERPEPLRGDEGQSVYWLVEE